LTGVTPTSNGWRVDTSRGDLDAAAVVLATGGLSVPKTGSDGTGLRVAASLGHVVHDTYPALTPLIAEGDSSASLSGVSLNVRLGAKWRGKSSEASGGFLFTHRGYSGPAVLDVSHIAVRSAALKGPRPDQTSERAVLRVAWSAIDAAEWQRHLTKSTGLVVS